MVFVVGKKSFFFALVFGESKLNRKQIDIQDYLIEPDEGSGALGKQCRETRPKAVSVLPN